MAQQLNDSYTKAMTQFNEIFGKDWQRHIHPQDRDEMCGYMIRMIGDDPNTQFNVWNSATNRPNGVEKIEGNIKNLIRCTTGRNYFVECPTINKTN